MKKLAFSLIVATAGMMAISANAMSPKPYNTPAKAVKASMLNTSLTTQIYHLKLLLASLAKLSACPSILTHQI